MQLGATAVFDKPDNLDSYFGTIRAIVTGCLRDLHSQDIGDK
jgi:hypothetical protein